MTVMLVNRLVEYEAGKLSPDEVLDLFCDLLNTGTVNEIQGSYQRTAKTLLESGAIVTGLNGRWVPRDQNHE